MTIEYKDSKRITGLAIDKTGYNDIQGYAGGAKSGSAQYGAGGGGGAGAVGNPDTSSGSGAGGIGVVNPITGSTVGQLDSGTTYYLAGGGGGGAHSSGQGTVGAGGKGGGHAGNTGSSIPSGTANTGGGAGGDSAGADSYTGGGIGGSGVVILSYKTSSITDNSTGGSLETGGNIPSGYAIRKFTATGNSSFIITGSGDVQYVVVAGGGGSGSQVGGGGGAGGYRTGTTTLSAGTYTVTVGAGGVACNTSSSIRAGNGADSVFNNITSTGGGGGADNDISPYTNGRAGGSGGGGTYRSGATGAGAGTTTVTDIHIKIPTNVQDNSIFIEKDTGKRYWGSSAPTFEDDFSSDNWTDTGSQIGVSGGKMAWNGLRNASFQGSYYDLGSSVSETLWELRFTLDIDAMTEGSANAYFNVGLSDTATMNVNTSQDWIGLLTFLSTSSANNSRFMAQGVNGSTITGGTDFGTSDPQSLGLFYVRIRRMSATSCIIGIYSNSDYSTLVEEETVTITSGIDNLQYLKITNLSVASGAGTGVFNGTIDDVQFWNARTFPTISWTYPPEGIDSSGQIAQLSGSNAANSYTAASEFYTISTDTWASAFNVSGGARARAGSAGSTEHAYLMGGQDGSGYFGTIDKVAWADETNTTISRSTRAWGGAVQNAVSVCVGQSYYYGSYQTGINEYTYGTMAETSQGNTSSSHAFGGSFGNSTYGFVINGQNTGIERYTYSDKSKTASGFTASPTTTNAGGHTGNSTTGISINNTAGSGNARYDAYNISADTWTTGSATSSTPYEAGRASGSSTWNLWSTQTNTSSARQCEKYNYSSGALSSFTSVATNLDGGDQDAGASSINTGVNS